jgi:putative glutamine amidotransferase
MRGKPIIGIPADRRLLGDHYFHCVGEKYIAAVVDGCDAVAMLMPSLGRAEQLQQALAHVDGILLTGSASNVEPHHYQGPASDPDTLHDALRDATTLPLIPLAIRSALPLLAVCRGFQEMNVAFGGTLWQKIHEVEGHDNHREDPQAPLDTQYAPAHEVELTAGGVLQGLAGKSVLTVNSLHSQGVQRLGAGLRVEARARDGVIEAFSVSDAPGFAVAVQWHPEWKFHDNPFSRALFAAFGAAARAYAARRAEGKA